MPPRWRAKHPISCYSHLAGALLSVVALGVLLVRSSEACQVVGFSIYGASLILLYSASALYHAFTLSPRGEDVLLRLDHVAIFLLIAGSYTPVCLVTLRGGWGWGVFGVVWGLAAGGTALKLFFPHLPRWLSTALYLGMGWLAVVAMAPIVRAVPAAGIAWLVAGGLLYTLGALVYAGDWPDPRAGVFGAHEIFHLLVLAGSAAHFVFMVGWVVPAT